MKITLEEVPHLGEVFSTSSRVQLQKVKQNSDEVCLHCAGVVNMRLSK
jgi:hypothetical protein